MSLFIGLSGWAYPEWRGSFYPLKEPAARMLGFYAQHFNTVEVNNTFYRMPSAEALAAWCNQVPPDFRFAFKAHRAITHRKRFADTGDFVDRFCDLLAPLDSRVGPVLFQFETIADVPQLSDFLVAMRPRFKRIVVEFRHASWFTDAAFDVLRANDVALCQTETDDGCDPTVRASGFSYLRLRKSTYSAAALDERLGQLQASAAGGHDVFCYLKHDAQNAVLLRELPRR